MMWRMYGGTNNRPGWPGSGRAARRQRGFSLMELMVVVVVVGVLAAIAYPSYTKIVIRNNRAVARAALVDAAARQESYYSQTKTYAGDLSQLGFPTSTIYLLNNGGLAPDTGSAPSKSIYLLRVASSSNRGFVIQADPVGSLLQSKDTECGILSINARGTKSASGGGDNCF